MGAPKQKWTAEEELALKAGIEKHGAGKWRTILKDPEFSHILYLRSNVDLKDKWRNMSVTSHDWGSRDRPRISWKRTQQVHRHDNSLALSTVDEDIDDEIVDVNPLAISDEILQIPNTSSIPRLDDIVLEAITNLKDPTGSSMTAIAMYIEEEYWSPPNLESMLSAKLKALTSNGKLIKVKRKYRITPVFGFSSRRSSRKLPIEGKQKELIKPERRDFKAHPKYQIDAEIARMRSMSSHEAAAVAAQAMIEAEAAIAEAEEAAREAEIAEADAEAAHAFAEAAKLTLKNRATDGLSMQES
ncbi:putative Histone H1.1 [Zostera marina]|uniref:Putative Histone H1.1 n=1 Tax=Zostera marina TaxID=29655 RepID=A0A0K9PHQ2_ZOSMR|nr:putative Histone H1.1 [Zostera marina]